MRRAGSALLRGGGARLGAARLHGSAPLCVAPAGEDSRAADPATSSKLAYISYENPKYDQSRPPLIIQHGVFGRKENFKSVGKAMHHLARRGVLVPDLRGHGDSPPCRNLSIRQMAADLQRLIGQLGVGRAAVLGHATGGRVAMQAALSRPELVSRLVVAAASPVDTAASAARWQRNVTALDLMAELLSGEPAAGVGAGHYSSDTEFKLRANAALKDTLPDPSERALFLSNLGRIDVSSLQRSASALATFPAARGRTYPGPALFITGAREPVWEDDQHIRTIRHLFPNSHFVKIPGASHWAHTEASDEFLAAVVSFLQTEF